MLCLYFLMHINGPFNFYGPFSIIPFCVAIVLGLLASSYALSYMLFDNLAMDKFLHHMMLLIKFVDSDIAIICSFLYSVWLSCTHVRHQTSHKKKAYDSNIQVNKFYKRNEYTILLRHIIWWMNLSTARLSNGT